MADVPHQTSQPWSVAWAVSLRNVRRRLVRSLITMAGVILAIAFLSFMLVSEQVLIALIESDDQRLHTALQDSGVDVYGYRGADRMTMLLLGLALLTALVGIINSMLMAVTERVKEIGTLKCIGALDGFILQTFLIESSLQGLIGTAVGLAVGLAVALISLLGSYGGAVVRYFPLLGALQALGLSLLIGGAISILASIAPAQWAARKQPVEAMRVEE